MCHTAQRLLFFQPGFVEFQMRGGFLLLLLYGSISLGPILGLLGLGLCIAALVRKDTTTTGRRKARTGLFTVLFGLIISIVVLTLLLNNN
ncbi:MAG: hypothetical protein JNL70_13785 [Saprospiraceae bacterium]|nr:hypothetical protein [Saprospiraceae bacterium]